LRGKRPTESLDDRELLTADKNAARKVCEIFHDFCAVNGLNKQWCFSAKISARGFPSGKPTPRRL
jgi:hypothetical protein